MSDVRSVAIVGASLAGLGTADSLRRAGFDGEITVIDAAPELPPDRPPLSKQVLRGESAPSDHPQLVGRRIDDLDLDLRLGVVAHSLDASARRVRVQGGDDIAADAIVIATGSRARHLPLGSPTNSGRAGIGSGDEALVLRDAGDAMTIAAAFAAADAPVAIIGAGFIGAEVAAAAVTTGHAVTMIEVADTPMQRVLPAPIGEWVRRLLVAHGVDVRTSTGFDDVVRDSAGQIEGLHLTDGSVVDARIVVAGIGAVPNVEWLDGSGLDLDNGVRCDATLCAAPGIFAAGDVANVDNDRLGRHLRLEQWENAVDQGDYLGARLLTSEPTPYRGLPWFWSDLFDVKLQLAGDPSPSDEVVVVDGSLDSDRFVALFRRGEWCSGVVGVGRPRLVMKARMALTEQLRFDDAVAAVTPT